MVVYSTYDSPMFSTLLADRTISKYVSFTQPLLGEVNQTVNLALNDSFVVSATFINNCNGQSGAGEVHKLQQKDPRTDWFVSSPTLKPSPSMVARTGDWFMGGSRYGCLMHIESWTNAPQQAQVHMRRYGLPKNPRPQLRAALDL